MGGFDLASESWSGASSCFSYIVHSGIIRTQSTVAPSACFIPHPTRLAAHSLQPCIYYSGDDCPPFICDWVLLKVGGFLPKWDACLMKLNAQKPGPHWIPQCYNFTEWEINLHPPTFSFPLFHSLQSERENVSLPISFSLQVGSNSSLS